MKAADEKGGVEGEGGRFRRNHCVPMRSRRLDRGARTHCWKPPMTPMMPGASVTG